MMKSSVFLFLPFLAIGADVTGEWNLNLIRFGESFAAARVNLKADGSKLTGTLNELKLEGTVEGDHLTITATRPGGNEWGRLDGRLLGDELSGTVKQGGDEFGWKARRVSTSKAAPASHDFEPTTF